MKPITLTAMSFLLCGLVHDAMARTSKRAAIGELRAQQLAFAVRAGELLGPAAWRIVRFARRTSDLAEQRLAEKKRKSFVEKEDGSVSIDVREAHLQYSGNAPEPYNGQVPGGRLELGPPQQNYRREYGAANHSLVAKLNTNFFDGSVGERRLIRNLTRAYAPLAGGTVLERADYTVITMTPRANGSDHGEKNVTRFYRHDGAKRAPISAEEYSLGMKGAPNLAKSSFLYHDGKYYKYEY